MVGEIKEWPLGDKSILWFAGYNKYMVVEYPVVKAIKYLASDGNDKSIVALLIDEFGLTTQQTGTFVDEVERYLEANLHTPDQEFCQPINESEGQEFIKHYYSIYGILFLAEFATEEAEELIHPKFEHLEVVPMPSPEHHLQVLKSVDGYILRVDGEMIGSWAYADNHYLGGKFSMQILQKIYKKEENEWMAVFHAAGVTNGEKCLMFLGDSGNGKSTLSAILMANGLEVLADDFLPVESRLGLVCQFPAAISIKKKAYELLLPKFPELAESPEVSNRAGKIFRYLPNRNQAPVRVPCVGLIFTKFEKDSGFCLEPMAHDEAFAHLVPDSWISPEPENAHRFVNWFSGLPCYRLTYSDNDRMVQTINAMLNHDV